MPLVTAADLPQSEALNLPPSIPLPRDRFSSRIKDVPTFGNSKSSGNPMLTFDCEIYNPDKVVARNGVEYVVAGVSSKMYFSLQPQALFKLFEFMVKLGLKPQIDPENPEVEQFKNKTFSAIWGAEERAQRKDLTEEDRLAGKKVGEVLLDENQQPIISYSAKVMTVLGPTNVQPPMF